jgi:hypothetical protein
MGYNVGQRCLAVGQYRAARWRPTAQIHYRLSTRHVVLPRTDHELAEQPPRAEHEGTKVNTQRCCHRETRTEFFPSHVGRAMNAHELVTNDNPSIQEGKEATGHSTGRQ